MRRHIGDICEYWRVKHRKECKTDVAAAATTAVEVAVVVVVDVVVVKVLLNIQTFLPYEKLEWTST